MSLSIAPGERVLLAGPSGSGKSTLLRALAGLLLTADAGELTGSVAVDGAPPQSRPGQIGLVLQDPGSGVVAGSVDRDVAFGLENVGTPRPAMAAPVAEVLREVGLAPAVPGAASPLTLSGGEQQRLALAGALAMEPQVLLLDEPTAMLDPATARQVRGVVGDVVRSRGLTLVVVEHRLGPWLDLVERLVVLDADGRVAVDGAPEAVLRERGVELAAQGIWVPGIPDPDPDPVLDSSVPAPRGGPRGSRTNPRGRREGVLAQAEGLSVRRRSRPLNGAPRDTLAVDGLDLSATAGTALALVGPSGSGKSTVLSAFAGLVAPTAGRVRFEPTLGEGPPDRWPSPQLAAAVSWVPQRAASTILRRTVREELLATSVALGQGGPDTQRRADALLDVLGLTAMAGLDPRRLSGGEQRRLAVAAAILHEPALVLADEPTVGQDRLTWAAVVGMLDAVRAAGAAVLVATHDDAVIARADEVIALRAGRRVPQVAVPDAVAPAAPPSVPAQSPADAPPLAAPAAEPTRTRLAARCGPLGLLFACLLVLPLPALVDTWRQALAVIAAQAVLLTVAMLAPGRGAPPVPVLRRTVLRAVPALAGVAGVVWSTWLLGGRDVEIAVGAGLRVVALVLPSIVLLPFVDPDALGDHLTQRLRLPARPVVAATAALGRFQSFGALWAELTQARRVRGVGAGRSLVARGADVGATTFGLFVGILGQAAVLALAMDARGFASAHRRTWAGTAPWKLADTLAVVAGVLVLVVAALAKP